MLQLQMGVAKNDITPRHAIPLAGFASRGNRKFETIESRLYVRTFIFEQRASDGLAVRALLISADILFWSDELANRLRERIERQFEISGERIILHATHTHSGPSISKRTIGIGEPDDDYLAYLEESVIDSVGQALLDTEPVTVYRGKGTSGIGVNRRKREDGKIILAPNPEGVTDPALNVIVFLNSEGKRKALLVHYACHPTLSVSNSVSSDFCGYAVELLENRIGSGAVCAYLQGCCGDINPYGGIGAFTDGQAVSSFGEALAEDVWRILSSELVMLDNIPFDSIQVTEKLPFAYVPSKEELMRLAAEGDDAMVRQWADRFVKLPGLLRPYAVLEITRLTIASGLTIVAMNGEMVVEYGLFVKNRAPGLIPIAYCNGMTGYITTAKQLEEGGYEPIESVTYFGNPAPFHESVEEKVLYKLAEIIDK